MALKLETTDHSRDIAGLKYLYPVLSRRSGGLSIGINFNTNNACNWRCIYCQVPDLKTGSAPPMDFALLAAELRFFLNAVRKGDFFDRFQVPEKLRVIKDIAISGNGEPTSLPEFPEAVELIGAVATEAGIFPESPFVLITNGSLMHRPKVQEGLIRLSRYHGEVWYKLDSATEAGRRFINHAGRGLRSAVDNLLVSANLCRTKLQICVLSVDRQEYPPQERDALLQLLKFVRAESSVRHVLLYTVERPSMQPEGNRLSKLPAGTMNELAEEVRTLGFEVSVSL
ncbi:MAG: radical SAM protein [Gammaproteobacteria bacterium]